MNFLFNNTKRTFGILFFICLGMMAVALFMEHFLSLKPCMLCYMQRGAVLILGLSDHRSPRFIKIIKINLIIKISLYLTNRTANTIFDIGEMVQFFKPLCLLDRFH